MLITYHFVWVVFAQIQTRQNLGSVQGTKGKYWSNISQQGTQYWFNVMHQGVFLTREIAAPMLFTITEFPSVYNHHLQSLILTSFLSFIIQVKAPHYGPHITNKTDRKIRGSRTYTKEFYGCFRVEIPTLTAQREGRLEGVSKTSVINKFCNWWLRLASVAINNIIGNNIYR